MKRAFSKLGILLVLSFFLSFLFPHESATAEGRGRHKEGELIVKFKDSASDNSKRNLHRRHNSEKIKEFPSLRIQHIKLKKGLTVEEAIARYKNDPDVEYAEPNRALSIQAVPNDPRLSELWNLNNTGQSGGAPESDIAAFRAWSIATGSRNVVVAVIDTGVDYTHKDLAANMWGNEAELNGLRGVDDDGNGYVTIFTASTP